MPPNPETNEAPQPEPDSVCWLCLGKGAVAVHIDATAQFGRPLWTAHKPTSRTHPVVPCPVCRGGKAQPVSATCPHCKRWYVTSEPGAHEASCPRKPAAEAQSGSYEATTGHLITCLTVAGGEADPDSPPASGPERTAG